MQTTHASMTAVRRVLILLVLALAATACGGDTGGSTDTAGATDTAADTAAEGADGAVDGGGQDRVAGGQLQQTLIPDPDTTGYQGALLELPVDKPAFVLRDTAGEPYDFVAQTADAAVTFLYFGYTTCPDICPAHMAAVASALRAVPEEVAEEVEVVFVSVDPERDVDLLRQYLDSFDPRFEGVIGTPEEVNQVMAAMGLHPSAIAEDGDFPPSHPINLIAFTGDQAEIAYPFGVHGGAIAQDLPGLVDEGVVRT